MSFRIYHIIKETNKIKGEFRRAKFPDSNYIDLTISLLPSNNRIIGNICSKSKFSTEGS